MLCSYISDKVIRQHRQSGSNTLEVADGVTAEMERLREFAVCHRDPTARWVLEDEYEGSQGRLLKLTPNN